jgi:hypothetical protein
MYACMLIVCVVDFPVIDLNDECTEEGEVFEYQEEGDQGQATQGKPSICCILIRPKRIYFPEHFCYCFSFNLCVLNTTNTD